MIALNTDLEIWLNPPLIFSQGVRLIGNLVGDFLLVIIEPFSLGAFVLSQYTRLTDGRTDRQTDRQNLDSNTVRMLRSRTVKRLHN